MNEVLDRSPRCVVSTTHHSRPNHSSERTSGHIAKQPSGQPSKIVEISQQLTVYQETSEFYHQVKSSVPRYSNQRQKMSKFLSFCLNLKKNTVPYVYD